MHPSSPVMEHPDLMQTVMEHMDLTTLLTSGCVCKSLTSVLSSFLQTATDVTVHEDISLEQAIAQSRVIKTLPKARRIYAHGLTVDFDELQRSRSIQLPVEGEVTAIQVAFISLAESFIDNVYLGERNLLNKETEGWMAQGQSQMGDAGVYPLAEFVKGQWPVKELCLSNTGLTDCGVIAVSEALLHNPHIKSLLLWRNQITCSGASALATAMAAPGCGVQELDLGWNKIGERGGATLCSALSKNKSIHWLNVQANDCKACGPEMSAAWATSTARPSCNLFVDE